MTRPLEEGTPPFRNVENFYPITQYHIPEGLNPQVYRCGNLKFLLVFSVTNRCRNTNRNIACITVYGWKVPFIIFCTNQFHCLAALCWDVHSRALSQLRKLVVCQLYILRVIGIGCEERLCLILPGSLLHFPSFRVKNDEGIGLIWSSVYLIHTRSDICRQSLIFLLIS
jgi:hypothetical protein